MMQAEVTEMIDQAYAEYLAREDRLHEQVGRLRNIGATWAQIGHALAVSPQAAQQRFGNP